MVADMSVGGMKEPAENPVSASGGPMTLLLITRRQADLIGFPLDGSTRIASGGAAGLS